MWISMKHSFNFSVQQSVIWMRGSFNNEPTRDYWLVWLSTFSKNICSHLSHIQASHCSIKEALPKSWTLAKVRLGEWDRATNPDCQEIDSIYYCAYDSIDVRIEAIYPHELYDLSSPNKLNDIAVLRLESAVAFNEFVRPICLPIDKSAGRYNTEYGTLTVTGFGKTESRNSSERMLKAEIDIVNHLSCKRNYRIQGRDIHETQICAIRQQADTWWVEGLKWVGNDRNEWGWKKVPLDLVKWEKSFKLLWKLSWRFEFFWIS